MRYDIETTLVIVMNVLFTEMLSAVLLIEFTVEALMQMCVQKHYNTQIMYAL